MVGNKNRHTGRQVSQAMSRLKACCNGGACLSPHQISLRNLETAEEQKLSHCPPPLFYTESAKSSHMPGDQSRKTSGLQETRGLNSHLQPGCPTDTKSRELSRYCPQTAGQRGLPKAQQPQYRPLVPLQVSPHQLENRCSGKIRALGRGRRREGWLHCIPAGFPEVLLAPGGRQAWSHHYPTALLSGLWGHPRSCFSAG